MTIRIKLQSKGLEASANMLTISIKITKQGFGDFSEH